MVRCLICRLPHWSKPLRYAAFVEARFWEQQAPLRMESPVLRLETELVCRLEVEVAFRREAEVVLPRRTGALAEPVAHRALLAFVAN